MKKLSLSLLAAGVMAVAGLARADAIFYPDGTSVDLGPNGADNLVLSSRDDGQSVDTTMLGAGPAVTTVTTMPTVTTQYVYVQPNINFDPAIARAQLRDRQAMHRMHSVAPMDTAVVVGGVAVPTTISEPYYVMSW